MGLFVTVFAGTVQTLLLVLEICMLLRAILSWFPIRDDNPILAFVAMVTEPIIVPVRALFERLGWFQNSPIDVSFFVAYLLLTILGAVVGVAL